MNQYTLVLICLITFFISSLATYISIPFSEFIGKKYKIVDEPSKRKNHNKTIIRAGGISIGVGLLLATFFSFLYPEKLAEISIIESSKYQIILAGIMTFYLGLSDDIYSLTPLMRLICQFLIGIFVWFQGVSINVLNFNLFGLRIENYNVPNFISILITVFLVSGLINAFNWLDGLDGLAIGTTLISAIFMMILSIKLNNYATIILSTALIGTSVGFLPKNFIPAKIFMGDGGSYLLGYTFSILLLSNNKFIENPGQIISSFFMVLFPLFDMALVISRRIIKGKSIFYPDNMHFHHFLLGRGISQKNSVLIIYSINFSLCIIGLGIMR